MIERSDIPQSKYGVARRFECSCCPYGYHIDLDFVKYCETLHKAPPISQRVRSARRQRHSMDIMMGFINVTEPSPIQGKNAEYDSICATGALEDAVCKFEMTLLSTAVAPVVASKVAELEPEVSGSALEYVREQMAQHLGRIRSLEEQLKVIPALRLQIDMLTEEKRRLEGRLLLSPKLSCRRDVGSQCIGIVRDDASTNTDCVVMIPKQLQCTPNIKSHMTQTPTIVTFTQSTCTDQPTGSQTITRDVSTLTETQIPEIVGPAVVAIVGISIATQTLPMQSVNKHQQTKVTLLSRGLQCNIRPATVEVLMQTIDPVVTYAETQTCREVQRSAETQTDEMMFAVSEESEMEEEEEDESIKSPLSAINEDTEERETATTHDSDNSIDVVPAVTPSREMLAALVTIGDALKRQIDVQSLPHANATLRREWFHVASTEGATESSVRAYLEAFRAHSSAVVEYMATLSDANGNTALHYAISHGNFPVVGALLDSGACDVNRCNNAGYTAIMLVSLVALTSPDAKRVVERLFCVADVNIRARKHSQTALMLAVSHGNINMVAMLIDAGADVNAQDEDGSTALMCAVEHGKMDIVKVLLAQPQCDSSIQDMDGSTALKISLDAGFHDIGILLYAHNRASRHRNGAIYMT